MTMLQGLRQQSVRDLTETAGSYESDWHALFDLYGIAAGPFNGRLLAWLNLQMATTIADLPGAMQAFAVTQGVTNWSSMGTWALTSPSTTLFDEMSTEPAGPRKALIDRTIRSLVSSGVWAKLDVLGLIGHASQASLLNWKNPGTFDATLTNAPTFTADRDFATNGSNSSVDLNFNPSTAGGSFAQDSAYFAIWSRTTGTRSNITAGAFDGTDGVTIHPRNASNQFTGRANQATAASGAEVDGSGFYSAARSASDAMRISKNGSEIATSAETSTALNNLALRLGTANGTNFAAMAFAGWVIGGYLTTAEEAALYSILLDYMQAIGAA